MKQAKVFLREDDVLSTPASALMYQCTFKVSEFLTIMQSKLLEERLFLDGMDCELLSAGKAWTKGKVRVRLEFYADEQEDQKFLPGGEDSDTAPENTQNITSPDTENDGSNLQDSTENTTNFPRYKYRNNNRHCVGMWS